MNLDRYRKLVHRITDALAHPPGSGATIALAAEYAQHCQEAAACLDRCAAMLAKGADYQALQLAEADPALRETLSLLRFPGYEKWLDHCREHELPVPPPFETGKISALEALYSTSITEAHPLYRDYRSATSQRDSVNALRIIRTIARLNPADINARQEQARLEEKSVRETAALLKTALRGGDEALAARLTVDLQALAPPARLIGLEDYAAGCAVHSKLARLRAEEFVRDTMEVATLSQQRGDWQSAAAALARIGQTASEYDIAIPPALQASWNDLRGV